MTLDDMITEGAPPIAAILRGVRPHEAVQIAGALIETGIRFIEVPLNSPNPFVSIRAICAAFGDHAIIGAGTVLNAADVDTLAALGARAVVTPNTQPCVIARAIFHGLEVLPGFATPTEALQAISAGACRIKLFPAMALGPDYLRALRDVLPPDVKVWAVGGTGADTIGNWLAAGAEGIGVGSALYRPGDGAREVDGKARLLMAEWRKARDAAIAS